MVDIGTLVTTLKLDSGKFSTDMKKAGKNVNSFSSKTNRALAKAQKSWASFGKRIKTVGIAAAGVAAVGGGLYILTKKSLDFADTIAKTADKIGLSTDALQEYRYVADRAGVATSMMDNGLVAFSKRVGELKQGTGALSTYLKKLDESFMNQVASAGSVDEALMLVFTRMNEMTSASDRAALGAAAFSRSAGVAMTNMASSVDGLRERAQRLGIVLDETLIRGSEKAIDSITDLEYVLKANLNRTLINIAPIIGQVATDMADWVATNDDFLKQAVPAKIEAISGGLKDIKDIYDSIPAGIVSGTGVGLIGAMLFGGKAGVVVGVMIALNEQLAYFKLGIGDMLESSKNIADIFNSTLKGENYFDRKGGTKSFSMPEQPPLPLKNKGVGEIPLAFDEDEYQKTLDSLTEKQSDYEYKARQLSRTTWEQKRQDVYRWVAETEAALKEAGTWTKEMETQLAATGSANLKLVNKEETLEDMKEISEAAYVMSSSIGDAIYEMVTTGKADFHDLADSIIADLISIQIQKRIVAPLGAGLDKGLDFLGTSFMNMFDSGGWVTEPVVGIGTRSGESYSFAERGPEFVSRHGGGSGGSSAPVINIENNTGNQIEPDNVQWDSERQVLGIVLEGLAHNDSFRHGMNAALRGAM